MRIRDSEKDKSINPKSLKHCNETSICKEQTDKVHMQYHSLMALHCMFNNPMEQLKA